MATRFQRGRIWYIRYKMPNGSWQMVSCGKSANSSDAELIRKKYDAEELNSRHKLTIRHIDIDLYTALEEYRKTVITRSQIGKEKARLSIRREQVCIENFVSWAKDQIKDFNGCTKDQLEKYFDHISTKSAVSKHHERRVLNLFFKWSISQGYCKHNPIAEIPDFKIVPKPPYFWSKGQLQEIFKHAVKPYDNIFKFLYLTGLRAGELRNLKWKDINLELKKATILPIEGNKTKRVTHICLSSSAIDILHKQIGVHEEYVFVNDSGNQLDNDNIYRNLNRTLIKAKIKEGSPHTFRHTCASHLVIDGVSLYIVKDILRHASIVETEIYSHLSTEAISNAVEKLTA